MDDAEKLAKSTRGAMIAAAGCGKTYLIAKAVAEYGNGRELILTHTHAGVDALRRRLAAFEVRRKACQVDTIAGWALRLAASFPVSSEIPTPKPRSNDEYKAVYAAAANLLSLRPIQEIIGASYTGVYVDEYQDCTLEQHKLVLGLANILPCRIVGDPLQGIFDFGNNTIIDWDTHVAPHFEIFDGPTTPWRWQDSNPELGEWLQGAREKLLTGEDIDLCDAPIKWQEADTTRLTQVQRSACFSVLNTDGDRFVAIPGRPYRWHSFAKHLKGIFSCVEAIDEKDLHDAAKKIDETSGIKRADAVFEFAKKCMTKITPFSSALATLRKGKIPKSTKFAPQIEAFLDVIHTQDLSPIAVALEALTRIPGVRVYRRELLQEMKRAVHAVAAGEAPHLEEAVWLVRNRTRQIGRQLPIFAVGTTLLVKGLEFDHAVVLDGDAHDAKNLYVALTRGSKSLTIVSRSQVIRPKKTR